MVHAVTDDRILALPDFLDRVRALAIGPDVAIHLRGRLAGRTLLALADTVRALTTPSGTALIVHDRADVARLCGADGVQLPAAGLPTPAVRALLGAGCLVGRSTHSAAEARAAVAAGATWALLGNVWPTPSHPERPGLGPEELRRAAAVPVVAIGGVTAEHARLAAEAGAAGVAAIRALWDAPDPAAAARRLRVCFPG